MRLRLASALSALLFAGCTGSVVVKETTPPPPHVEMVGEPPSPDQAWLPGHWVWRNRWVWVAGRWAMVPRSEAVWVPGRWVQRDRGWVWIGGYWR